MFFTEETIIDSSMSFSDAIEGTIAPPEIIDLLSLIDVCYYSFDGRKHQGKLSSIRNWKMMFMRYLTLLRKFYFPSEKLFP